MPPRLARCRRPSCATARRRLPLRASQQRRRQRRARSENESGVDV